MTDQCRAWIHGRQCQRRGTSVVTVAHPNGQYYPLPFCAQHVRRMEHGPTAPVDPLQPPPKPRGHTELYPPRYTLRSRP